MAFSGRVYLSRWGWAEPAHVGRGRQFRAANITWVGPDASLNSRQLPGGDVLVLERRTQVVWLRVPVGMIGKSRSRFGRDLISRRRRTIRSSEPDQVRGFHLAVEG
jgi:hypothetical protein